MNHLLNLVKLASSFPKEINLELPNSCVLSSHLSFPRERNLGFLCPLFTLAFPQARLFFPRANFGSVDDLLKKGEVLWSAHSKKILTLQKVNQPQSQIMYHFHDTFLQFFDTH